MKLEGMQLYLQSSMAFVSQYEYLYRENLELHWDLQETCFSFQDQEY